MNLILFDDIRETYELPSGDPRHRHIRSVLRASPGDTVRIGVVGGPEGVGTVAEMDRTGSSIIVTGWTAGGASRPIEVVLGHPRPPVVQRLWRDLAAVRVRRILVFAGDLGERTYFDSSVWTHLEERLREGLSQGRHTVRPTVTRHPSLETLFDELAGVHYRYYGSIERPRALPFREMLNEIAAMPGDEVVSVCIGCERGFSDREHALLEERAFRPVTLGDSIVRTETAANALAVGIASACE
ncbi:MAG: RsmE family RNA methyltransferase [Spirochaeta sp.]|nr:RsmE family RNA methyltransferase [Spirochaeta sp.]